jgi:hypothetical protein
MSLVLGPTHQMGHLLEIEADAADPQEDKLECDIRKAAVLGDMVNISDGRMRSRSPRARTWHPEIAAPDIAAIGYAR